MAPDHSPVPRLPEVEALLSELERCVRAVLGDRFVGLYLYGSLASGDFQPARSDIDFVVVTDGLLPDALIGQLRSLHEEIAAGTRTWSGRLEGAYVPLELLRRAGRTSPPLPTVNEGQFYLAPLGSDWVIQRYVLRTQSAVVSGPPLADLIDPVSPDDLRQAVRGFLEEWWAPMLDDPTRLRDEGYAPYAVLTLCRALYTLEYGETISKSDAARWALRTLPRQYRALIAQAVTWTAEDPNLSIESTLGFLRFALERSRAASRS